MGRGTLLLLGVIALAAIGAAAVGLSGGDEPPQQPIPFPHDVHAGTNQTPCLYCHSSADKSVSAGIPSVEVCAGCHYAGGVPQIAADSAGVRQLIDYWTNEEPIPWVRVYDLADHAHFPHMVHVNAEDLECQECHGQIEAMEEVYLNQDLYMGWCLECHEDREVRIDCTVCHY